MYYSPVMALASDRAKEKARLLKKKFLSYET